MKLISLNIWGGHVLNPLLNFIENNQAIDIFCLQEVYHQAPQKISTEDRTHHLNIYSEIQQRLPDHKGFFRPVVGNTYGIGIFVKNQISILEESEIIIHDNPNYSGLGPTHSRNLQWLTCRDPLGKLYCVLNVHGLWNGNGKTDNPERIMQSNRIKDFMQTINNPKILCGDFNLNPDTLSLKIIEENMSNHIKLNNINSTRTRFYPKPGKFADYIFTSSEVQTQKFCVLTDEVSDHAPLYIDFI